MVAPGNTSENRSATVLSSVQAYGSDVADAAAKPSHSPPHSKSHDCQVKPLVTGKREASLSFLRKGERRSSMPWIVCTFCFQGCRTISDLVLFIIAGVVRMVMGLMSIPVREEFRNQAAVSLINVCCPDRSLEWR